MKKIIRMLSFLKTVNVVYQYQNLNDREDSAYRDEEVIFIDTCLRSDLPRTGEAIIYKGQYFRIATIWYNKDQDIIEIDLNDL
jgi:hypothetical protein